MSTQEVSSSDVTGPVPQDFIKVPSGKKFEINSKSFFLTYPRCEMTPEALRDFLEKLKPMKQYIVVQELHKDGTPHLHAIVEYEDRFKVKRQDYFDLPVEPFHGNYGTVKNYPAAIRYLKKSGTPISNWDYETYLKRQTKKGNLPVDYTEVNTMAREQGIRSLVDAGKIPLDKYGAWKRGLAEYEADVNRPVPVDVMHFKLPITYNPDTYHELDVDLTVDGHRHFWFYGSSGTGKTWTAKHQQIPYYEIPKNNDWIGYAGQQLLILNEFKGEMTPTQLIGVMESAQQNIKGSSAALPKNVFLIVTSNYSLRDCYHNLNQSQDEQLNALDRRFTQVRFDQVHPSCPTGSDFLILNALTSMLPQRRPGSPSGDVPSKRLKDSQGIN